MNVINITNLAKISVIKLLFFIVNFSWWLTIAEKSLCHILYVLNIWKLNGKSFLHLKFIYFILLIRNSYGMYFHLLNLAIYIMFLFFLTLNSIKLMDIKYELNRLNTTKIDNYFDEFEDLHYIYVKYNHVQIGHDLSKVGCVTSCIVFIFVIFNIFKEFYQIYQQVKVQFLFFLTFKST